MACNEGEAGKPEKGGAVVVGVMRGVAGVELPGEGGCTIHILRLH